LKYEIQNIKLLQKKQEKKIKIKRINTKLEKIIQNQLVLKHGIKNK
jgi:hypothetical protein